MSSKEQTGSRDQVASKQQAPYPATQNFEPLAQQPYSTPLIPKARFDPRSLTPAEALQLQRAVGNRTVRRLLVRTSQRPSIQTKLIAHEAGGGREEETEPTTQTAIPLPAEPDCPDCDEQLYRCPDEEQLAEANSFPFDNTTVQKQEELPFHPSRQFQPTEANQDLLPTLPRLKIQNRLSSALPIMRQRRRRRRRAASNFRQQVYIVRDRTIGLGGGHLVSDLTAFKRHVMRLQNTGQWTLVLAIHGSLERLGAQAPPDWQRNAIFYEAADINQLFSSDPDWVAWRDRYGPNHLSLVACQVSTDFERTIINNLTRHAAGTGDQAPRPTQRAQGLGVGCKPISEAKHWTTASGRRLRTRRQYQRLPAEEQQQILDELRELNRTYGYYGAPPVPEEQILNYFFDEAPAARWVVVTVGKKEQGTGHQLSDPDIPLRDTGIPFWNRSTGPRSAEYRRICDQGVGRLRSRQSTVPPIEE